MEFINALVWFVAILAAVYGGMNVAFIARASGIERQAGAPDVWFTRLLKSSAVVVVSILWLTFG